MKNVKKKRLTVFIHASLQTFLEATSPALVAMCLVNEAATREARLAVVLAVSSDGPFEEAGATVAGEDTVVFAGGVVPADGTRHVVEDTTL